MRWRSRGCTAPLVSASTEMYVSALLSGLVELGLGLTVRNFVETDHVRRLRLNDETVPLLLPCICRYP